MKVYQLALVKLSQVDAALAIAKEAIAYDVRVDLKPKYYSCPQVIVINTWCKDDAEYVRVAEAVAPYIPQ